MPIIEDGIAATDGQLNRTAFFSALRESVREVVEAALTANGMNGRDCPYLDRYLEFYRHQSLTHIARAVQLYAQPDNAGARGWIDAITRRAEHSAHLWVQGETDPLVGSLSPTAAGDLSRSIEAASSDEDVRDTLGPGRPLPGAALSSLESSFGVGLDRIRVHTSEAAQSVAQQAGALAFAIGNNIGFAPDRFQPGTHAGDALIAHEIAHTQQQRSSGASSLGAEEDADAAAIAAMTGDRAQVRTMSPLSLQACADPMTQEAAHDYIASHHFRVVLVQKTVKLLSGMRKQVAVAASTEPATEISKQPADELITHGGLVSEPRLFSARLTYSPNTSAPESQRMSGYTRPLSPHGRTGWFTAHFMGVGDYTIEASGRAGPLNMAVERTFTAEQADFTAASTTAVPENLGEQRRSVEEERLYWLLQRSQIRQQAADGGHISGELHASWTDLSIAIIQRAAEVESSDPTSASVAPLQAACDDFRTKLLAEPDGQWKSGVLTFISSVRWRGEGTDVAGLRRATVSLQDAFDKWLVTVLEVTLGENSQLTRTATHAIETDEQLRRLESLATEGDAKQIPAVFHAKSAYLHRGMLPTEPMSTGEIVPLPLSLWLAQTSATSWELRDITFPSKVFRYRATADTEQAALGVLFGKLRNDEEHFPDGRIYLHAPGYERMDLDIQSDMDFIDWMQIAAVAFAAIGFAAVTLGSGTAVSVGMVMIAIGSIAGGGAAIADTVNAYENGRLTGTRLALNGLQIVASVASLGSASIATRALASGERALAGLGSNARYLMLNRVAAGADVASFVLMTGDAAQQLSQLNESDSENKGMHATLLLSQLLIQGTLTVVSARNEFRGDLNAHPPIRIASVVDGVPTIRNPAPDTDIGALPLFHGGDATAVPSIQEGIRVDVGSGSPGRRQFGAGFYLADDVAIAQTYADQTGSPNVMGFGDVRLQDLGEVLDLTSGQGQRQWQQWLDAPFAEGISLKRGEAWRGQQEAREAIFEGFVRHHGFAPDVVVAPHPGGRQVVIRTQEAADNLQRFVTAASGGGGGGTPPPAGATPPSAETRSSQPTTGGSLGENVDGPVVRSNVDELMALSRATELPAKQQGLLHRMQAPDDLGPGLAAVGPGEVGALDLALLTRFHPKHSEYALVRINDGRTVLVEMGSYSGGHLPANTDMLFMHSHPPDGGSGMARFVSRQDVEALAMLGQSESYIVLVDGTVYRFTPDTPPDTIGELVRQAHAYYGWVDASGAPAGPVSMPGLMVNSEP